QVSFTPAGKVQGYIAARVAGNRTVLDSTTTNWNHAANRYFWIKAVAVGTNPTTLNMKIWQDGTPEPSNWTLSDTDSSPALQTAAPPGLHINTGGSNNLPITFSWDNLTISDGSTQGATP